MADTQPRTFKLSPSALLSLPRRLCGPPPSVGKVRSCSATAVVDVTLDDVLDKKHLPPLGLKDFEEWLLFVEQNAENLYFILWLREYNSRYTQWIKHTRALLKSDSSHPYQSTSHLPPIKPNRSLALFYSRAKQTFFTPNSPYELDLPSDILGPFHALSLSSDSLNPPQNLDFSASSGALSPHPDPAVFSQVEDNVRSMLQESLSRFANSTISNVGTARATCGLVGGAVIALLGFLPPIAENFALSKNRWLRIVAFPGLWLGLTIVLASLHGVCMMIYVFGDLRQLRSFELVRPPISSPRRLRPLRNTPPPVDLEPCLTPITRPPIIPKSVHRPHKLSSPPHSTNPIRFLAPIPEPISPQPSSRLSSNTGLRIDTTNPRASGSFTSCDSDASCTSTSSSDQVEIHISEAFYDIEPPYLSSDFATSSPVPSSWQTESPSNSPSPWVPARRSSNVDSALPSLPPDDVFRNSHPKTSTTLESEEEIWIPTARFIKPFEYDEWDEWDGESVMYTAEGSLGGYGGGDEESRISHFVRSSGLRQDGSTTIGTRVPVQFRTGSTRGTISSSKNSGELGTFDFDGLPAFQTTPSPTAVPALQRRPRYRTCDASPPPPPHDETRLIETSRQDGLLRAWFMEAPKLFIRRAQGRCGAAKQVTQDVLSRSAHDMSRRNDGDGGAYRDAPETDGKQSLPIAGGMYQVENPVMLSVPRPFSHPSISDVTEKNTLDVKPAKENWRVRWRRVLSVPAFGSPLTKILSPVVTRAQWEIVIRSGVLSFVLSFIVIAALVAVPVP